MYNLVSKFNPSGDQQQAIDSIVNGVKDGLKEQVLQGVTGSGKTFTMANIIKQCNKPTLVLAHNKTLAGQLCSEFKEFFPNNRVEYFVSYYDYYQPEAYIAKSDTYIEKDSSVNDEIDKLRHSATSSMIETNNVIVVASVSCIYALGAPQEYYDMSISLRLGATMKREDLISKLIDIRYERNDVDFKRSTFRVKGDIIDIIPSNYGEQAIRVEFYDDEIENIYEFDIVSNKLLTKLKHIAIFPATHYAVNSEKLLNALNNNKKPCIVLNDEGNALEINRANKTDLEIASHILGDFNGQTSQIQIRIYNSTPNDLKTIESSYNVLSTYKVS